MQVSFSLFECTGSSFNVLGENCICTCTFTHTVFKEQNLCLLDEGLSICPQLNVEASNKCQTQ